MRGGYAEVERGRLYYEVTGSGPVVTLIHPGLWDRRTWDEQFEAFAERFTVLRYDVRGYGRSDRPEEPYSDVDDLHRLLGGLGIERSALVGVSMGGAIAIDFTIAHRDVVWALVPCAPGLGGFEWSDEKWEPIWAPIQAAIDAGDLERATDLGLEIWAMLGTGDPVGSRIREIALENRHQFLLDEGLELRPDPPSIERLEEIGVPTLVILASHDADEMPDIGEILSSRIPGARKVVLGGTDHVVNMRRPEEFTGLVLDFLLGAGPK